MENLSYNEKLHEYFRLFSVSKIASVLQQFFFILSYLAALIVFSFILVAELFNNCNTKVENFMISICLPVYILEILIMDILL